MLTERDLYLYDRQPFADGTGIPDGLERACGYNGCGGAMLPELGTQHFDADGTGSVSTRCNRCGVESGESWWWPETTTPPAEDETLWLDGNG